MRNGSSFEYYFVEGALKLTRMRQSEWRRRGVGAIIEFDGQVGASADDGWSRTDGTFNNNGSQMYVGLSGTFGHGLFSRFLTVTIPGGASVRSAKLTFVMEGPTQGSASETKIFFDDIDTAVAPTNQSEHAALSRTTTGVQWDNQVFADETEYESPDIKSVIQEVLDRPGWSSGNALQLLWDNTHVLEAGNEFHGPYTYDGDTTKAMKLHVEYTT